MFVKLLAIDLKRKAKVMVTPKKYRTKFYLRKVKVTSDMLRADVEPVAPYLFRTREKEYYGILREVSDSGQLLDAKLVPLSGCKLSNGDISRCFNLELKLATNRSFEAAIIGKSVDTIVEIEFEKCKGGKFQIRYYDAGANPKEVGLGKLQLTSITAG